MKLVTKGQFDVLVAELFASIEAILEKDLDISRGYAGDIAGSLLAGDPALFGRLAPLVHSRDWDAVRRVLADALDAARTQAPEIFVRAISMDELAAMFRASISGLRFGL